MKLKSSHKCKKIIICLVIALTIAIPSNAFALTASSVSSNAIRNKISSSWSYKQRGYYENNCLAWALGNTTNWIWPWGQKNLPLLKLIPSCHLRGIGILEIKICLKKYMLLVKLRV